MMQGQRVSIPKISDAIASTLEQRILDGSLKPGDALPPERLLAAELGVSRPSLREAIQKLASKGLLKSRQGGGTYVTDQLVSDFFNPWQEMLETHPNLREDLFELRRVLEGQAAEWAAERGTDADFIRITQARAQRRDPATTQNPEDKTRCDIAFHQTIAEASHNILTAHLISVVLKLMEKDIALNLAELSHIPRAEALVDAQYEALCTAVFERRPGAARSAAETHMDFIQETMAQSLRSAARRETANRRLLNTPPGDWMATKGPVD